MNFTGAQVVLFALATISAAIAALKLDFFPKIEKVAAAVCFAAAAFFLGVAGHLSVFK